MAKRKENDAMGTVWVPETAYYGPQTQRAADNFKIGGFGLPAEFIRAVAMIKLHAARVNRKLGIVDGKIADAIEAAAGEVCDGAFDDQFIVDVFQTGSGTSTNMNVNEVIAGRANEMLTGTRGGKSPVHPNDHVNRGQSSNDVIPSAIHLSARLAIHRNLIPALQQLETALDGKAGAFSAIPKLGRTHLQDAVPMTLGQEFSGYAAQIRSCIQRIESADEGLAELALGGTAVGTGLNTHPAFPGQVIQHISEATGLAFFETTNHFKAQAAQDAVVQASGVLKTLAVALTKIANDIRWLASGPRCGIGEIRIPELQPGSSIMPGKINPVIPEAVLQVAAQVIGNDAAITVAGQGGNFELNVMLPVAAYNLLQSISLLAAAVSAFAEKCIEGIEANRQVCKDNIEKSLAMATGLVPHIGYDRASEIAKKAFAEGKTIRQVAKAEAVLEENIIDRILNKEG